MIDQVYQGKFRLSQFGCVKGKNGSNVQMIEYTYGVRVYNIIPPAKNNLSSCGNETTFTDWR